MRTLHNKSITIQREVQGQDPVNNKLIILQSATPTNYFTLLHDIIKVSPKDGYATEVDAMKQYGLKLELIDKLDPKKKEILLEESEYELLMLAYKDFRWAFLQKEIHQFDKYLKEIPKKPAK